MALRSVFLFVILVCFRSIAAAQTSNAGGSFTTGDIVYTYLGPGAAPNTSKYEIALFTSADCSSIRYPDTNPSGIFFVVYAPSTGFHFTSNNLKTDTVVTLRYTPVDQCLDYREPKCMETRRSRLVIDLPIIKGDYIVHTNLAGRRTTLVMNVDFNYTNESAIFVTTIPGTDKTGSKPFNSSPRFTFPTEQNVCVGTSFTRDFWSADPDGDKVTYTFSELNTFDLQRNPFPVLPPYPKLVFANPFSADVEPLGTGITLDENSGILSGVAPAYGYYRVGVLVSEYRNGVLLSQHTKESLVYANYCQKAKAELKAEYTQCKSFTFQFKNEYTATLPVRYHWDFGLKNRTDDTSNLETPTFTYPDTGSYTLKLFIYNGSCADSATAIVRVYPGFKPGFMAKVSCANLPVQFIDTSSTPHGFVNSWRWNFGDPATISDTATEKDPTYQYPGASIYTVRQIVTTSVGCKDTSYLRLDVYKQMFVSVSNDTTICGLDTIALHVTGGNGTITWSPGYAINDVHAASPLVSPDVTTRYNVLVSAGPGCMAEDSVLVTASNNVVINAFGNRQVCEGDSIQLRAVIDSNVLITWAPDQYIVSGKNESTMIARPASNVTYVANGYFGSCVGRDSVSVNVYPYPEVITFGDTTVCLGKTISFGVDGNADQYTWSPGSLLSDVHAKNHQVALGASQLFTVKAQNATGCTRPVFKTVAVNIAYPVKAFAGHDTAAIRGQQIQLAASGGDRYEWTPSLGLSNAFIHNPVASLNETQRYQLQVTDRDGCIGYDTVTVRVFQTDYEIFVPTAFTPNNDGLNDVFTPLAVGIASDYALEIRNRWGAKIFSSSQPNRGWDGTTNGIAAGSGVYVYYVKGKTVDGRLIARKGTVTLIR